jgi:hypothetical protein
MTAWNPSFGDRFGSRMGAAVTLQSRKNVRMRPVGAFSVWRWNRLKDLDPSDFTEKDSVRIYRQNDVHRSAAGSE